MSFPHVLQDLLSSMTGPEPHLRCVLYISFAAANANSPNMQAVVSHPLFWSNTTCLQYIYQVSNLIDYEATPIKKLFFASLENEKGNWRHKITDVLWNYLTLHRPYVETNPLHLIRAIRNLYEHWKDIRQRDPLLFSFFGSLEGVWTYFSATFPTLLISIFKGISALNLSSKLNS